MSIIEFFQNPVVGIIGIFGALAFSFLCSLIWEYIKEGEIKGDVWRRTIKVFLTITLVSVLLIIVFAFMPTFPPDATPNPTPTPTVTDSPTPTPTPTPSPAPVRVPYTFVNGAVERVVREKLNKSMGSIYTDDLEGIIELDLSGHFVNDLTDIAALPCLRILTVSDSEVDAFEGWNGEPITLDLSPLAGLSDLRFLKIYGVFWEKSGKNILKVYNIDDLCPLSGMTKLIKLNLSHNNISDVTPLNELTQLWSLGIGGNNISDVGPLRGLMELQSLYLGSNNISDVNSLGGLTRLQSLDLGSNNISDISPLSGLVQLKELWLFDNNISNVRPLSGLKQLQYLDISGNRVEDTSSVSFVPELIR